MPHMAPILWLFVLVLSWVILATLFSKGWFSGLSPSFKV